MKRTVVIFGVVPIAVVALVGCKTANKTDETTTTTSTIPILEQPAVWPSSDKKFDTPEAVADDFVRYALRAEPNLGEFMAGDSLSGEIDVLVPGSNVVRGTLLLRKLGSPQSWFVIGAVSDHASITSPAPQTEIPSGVLQVTGNGRGFEAQLHLTAIDPLQPTEIIDEAFPMGGSAEISEPFSASVDLSNLKSGTSVALVLQGGVGMEGDPGDFCALVVLIE